MPFRQCLVPRWVDINGGTVTQAFTTQANPAPALGTLADVLSGMQALSSCGLAFTQLSPVQTVSEAAVTGSYPLVSDRAQIILRSSNGNTGRINIPGPIAEMFLTGGQKVDFANPQVVALLSAVFANLSDPYGNPWIEAVSGQRFKVRIPNPMSF